MVMALVANKSDLDAKREVKTEVSKLFLYEYMVIHTYINFAKSKCTSLFIKIVYLKPHILKLVC